MSRVPLSLVVGFLLLLGIVLRGAEPSPDEGRLLSRVFLPEDYRGDTEVSDVVQAPDGLIYAANLGALKEYDGRAWSTIPVPTGWIRQLAIDDAGSVFFAAFDEIGPVEQGPDGQRRFRSLLEHVPESLKPLGRVRACVARDNAVFWNTARHVLCWRDGRMTTWTFAETADLTLFDGGTHVYLADAGKTLAQLAGDTWEIVAQDDPSTGPCAALLDTWAGRGPVAVGTDGRLWQVVADAAPVRIDTGLIPDDVRGGVTDALVLRDGRLALSTAGSGLLVLAPGGRIDLRFGTDGGVGLPILHRITQDREGGLWMGSGLGLVRVDLDRGVTVFDEKAGIPPGVGLSVFSHDGMLHSCGEDGLYRFAPGENGRRGKFVRVEGPVLYPYGTETHASGRLVLSDKGLFRFAEGTFIHQLDTPDQAYVIHVSQAEPDRLFLAGTGFLRMARWDGEAWQDDGVVESMQEDAVSIAEDRDGSLWIGTPTHGPVRVHRKPGETDWHKALTTRYGPERGLPEHHEWVSTYPGAARPLMSHSAGVSVFEAISDRLVPDPGFTVTGRNGRYVFPLTATPTGTVWAQVGNPARDEPMELGGVEPLGSTWRWVALPPRILDAMGFPGAYQMSWQRGPDEDGLLWIVTRGRIFRIDLAAERRLPPAPPAVVLVRAVRLGASALATQVTTPEAGSRVRLAHSREPLNIRMACPFFGAGGKIEFQHRLLGFRDSWSPWSASADVEFTNLPPGRYVCEMRARLASGAPGPATQWHCTIVPHWWEGWPALVLLAACACAAFILALRWRTRSLERERTRLERVVGQRTSELAEARDRADAANRAKTAFLASMSHELRTPLHAILGYAHLLGGDSALPAGARERLGIIGSSGRHLLRLINDVLDLSKIEAGRLDLHPAPFDLPALLQEISRAHEPRATARGLVFRGPEPAGLPAAVLGDAAKLRQVLENLLGNAIKFTHRGEVRLLAMPGVSGRVHFEVSDTGPGIPPEDLERLFQPFTQLHHASGAEPGTGLGLAIAQRLVVLMGGRIEASSTVGQGSRFRFEIPLPATGAAGRTPSGERRILGYEGPRRRVLVADDVEANRRLFCDILAPLGFEIAEADSGAGIRTRLDTFRPDLLILDLHLPDGDGLELARSVRARRSFEGLRILATSASVLGDAAAAAAEAGCDGFEAKPVLPAEFLDRIGTLLGLSWRFDDGAGMTRDAVAPVDPALLAPLHAAACTGDIVAVREAFEQVRKNHPDAALLEPLAAAIAAFDTARLAHLTRPLPSGPSA